jgi:hypothetical protein
MKKLLIFIALLLGTVSLYAGDIKFRLRQSNISSNVNGTVINRGDEFELWIDANGNGNTTTRQVLFDLQFDNSNFELISANHTGTGGNGGVLPQGSTISISHYVYPGYSFASNQQNSTSNGTTNYQNAGYTYTQGGPNAILRVTLSWTTNNGMPYTGYDRLIILKFKLRATSTAYTFDPIKMNFAAAWNGSGGWENTIQESPLSSTVTMNQNFGKYVTGKVDVSSNLFNISGLKVSFRDTLTNQGVLFDVTSNGSININQSQLAANKVYDVTAMVRMDTFYTIMNNAITISDFTAAQSEFTSGNLNGTMSNLSIRSGQSAYAADINRDRSFNGADLPMLLAQVAGIDTLVNLPSGYTIGSGGYMSVPTWHTTEGTTIPGATEWAVLNVNGYSTGISKFFIDKREFVQGGPTADQIKSLQIFDLYAGPVAYDAALSDNTWAVYKVPSSFGTIGTSIYSASIRAMTQSGEYGLKAEFEFNTSPNNAWGAITPANWNTITAPRTYFKTGALGTNAQLNLKYVLWGDVNRSHSSQVLSFDGSSTSTVVTNAVNSLSHNDAFISMANTTMSTVKTTEEIKSIDVNLSNLTVTSNTIEVPVVIDTKGNNVGGLQFEFKYDPSKIKFEELLLNLPNTWYTFVNSVEGRVKFGSLDRQNGASISGVLTPFKLKFSSLVNGLDLLTVIRVSPVMDASDNKGIQMNINLNSTQIKLVGYNNF